ncbi:MAG: GspE/PulE family protein [Elusimicrobiales bacterium]|nr:GspE/PulE family protein [Elusimicrobiales bacterium]
MISFGSKPPQDTAGGVKISGEPMLVKLFSTVVQQRGSADPNELAARLAALILGYAVKEGVSDVHFDPSDRTVNLRFRVDGQLKDMLTYPKREFPITARIRVMADFPPQATTTYTPEDGRFQVSVDGHLVQFRLSSFPTIFGEKLVLRVLDMGQNTLNLNALGFTPDMLNRVRALAYAPSGMFIVGGLTGCGKTTTLCSILNARRNEDINIMTLEDPVEYVLPRVCHSQINVKTGFTFAEGLRTILRQDPNIVMLGEVRDNETAEISFRAAMTGHLLFSTVHASSTTSVIHRLLGMGIEPYMIASSLLGVLAQRLVRKICPDCAQPIAPDINILHSLIKRNDPNYMKAIVDIVNRPGACFVKGRGCPACRNTGFRGRTGIFELLIPNDAMRSFIVGKNGADIAELRQIALQSGLRTLLMDGVEKCHAGITTVEEIAKVVDETF